MSPFLVVWLFSAHGVAGVLDLMIGLLVTQSVVVLFFGIESRNRRLETLQDDGAPATLIIPGTLGSISGETSQRP